MSKKTIPLDQKQEKIRLPPYGSLPVVRRRISMLMVRNQVDPTSNHHLQTMEPRTNYGREVVSNAATREPVND